MTFDADFKLLDQITSVDEKRKFFDHLENIFVTQNDVDNYFLVKLKRLSFEFENNNISELENCLQKITKDRLSISLGQYFDFLIFHFAGIGNVKKVKENLQYRLKNSLLLKRNQGLQEILKRFEKVIYEDSELTSLVIQNLHVQKDYSTIKDILNNGAPVKIKFDYEDSLSFLHLFNELFLDKAVSLTYSSEEKIDVCLARDLILARCEDELSAKYYSKAILLSADEDLIEELLLFLKSKKELDSLYIATLEMKKNYTGEGKTKIDFGKDLLNYTSFSKIKKANDSQILRNMGEETRAINVHEFAKAIDLDATTPIRSSIENYKATLSPKEKRNRAEEKELGPIASGGEGYPLEDVVCAHLFMGQYHLALKMINRDLKDNGNDLASEVILNLNYYKILCLIKIGDISMAMQLINDFLNELEINNHQYSTFIYLKYLAYLESGEDEKALSIKSKLSRTDPYFKKISGGLI